MMVSVLPDGWCGTLLGELAETLPGRTHPKPKSLSYRIPVVRLRHLLDGEIVGVDTFTYLPEGDERAAKYLLQPGDILLGITNHENATTKAAVYKGEPFPCTFATNLVRIRLGNGYNHQLFAHFLNSPQGRSRLASSIQKHKQLARINRTKLRKISVPVPPLNEQKRMAAKLEDAQKHIRALQENGEKLVHLLNQLRQSVLASAFCGALTKEWRQQNTHATPAEALLADLNKERCSRWLEAEVQEAEARASRRAKNWTSEDREKALQRARRRYQEPQMLGELELPTLPESWRWSSLAVLLDPFASFVRGVERAGPEVDDGTPCVRPKDIKQGKIVVDQLRRISPVIAEKHSRTSLKEGDVLLALYDTPKAAMIVTKDLEGANIVQGIALLRPLFPWQSSFLAAWLGSPFAQRRLCAWLDPRAALFTSNLRTLKGLPVPIPPFVEQEVIAGLLGQCLNQMETLEKNLSLAEQERNRLSQSILAKAFRGELVAQDSGDEPAAALLARSKAERQNASPRRKRRNEQG